MRKSKNVKLHLFTFFLIIILSLIIILLNISTISFNEKIISLKEKTQALREENNFLYFEIIKKTSLKNLEIEAKKIGLIPPQHINYIKVSLP